jgi:hypothetical protein
LRVAGPVAGEIPGRDRTLRPGNALKCERDALSAADAQRDDAGLPDRGAPRTIAYPTPTTKRKHTFMLFGYPTGTQGNGVNAGVNELIIPDYKHNWANIRKISDAPAKVKALSFKSTEYSA